MKTKYDNESVLIYTSVFYIVPIKMKMQISIIISKKQQINLNYKILYVMCK